MSDIVRLIAGLSSRDVPRVSLGEAGTFLRGNGLQKKDLVGEGVGAIHYGQVFTAYGTSTATTRSFVAPPLASKLRKAKPGDLVIATTSENDEDVCKAVAWLGEGEIAVSGDAFIYSHSMDPLYVAYYFQTEAFQSQKRRFISGTKVKRVSGADLGRIEIPVPPVEIQREIASILGKMEELNAELESELEYRSRQYAFYRQQLLTFSGGSDSRWSTLGGVCERAFSGGTPLATRSDYYGGSIPWLRTQEVDYGEIHQTSVHITETGLANSSAKWVRPDSVIVAISGAGVTRGRSAINKIALTTNQHCCNLEVDESQARHRFVYYWLVHNYDDLRSRGRGNRSDLNVGLIKNYPIALPSLEEQERIVAVLDRFDTLVNDLSVGLPAEIIARQTQYEHYRDRLLTFEDVA